MTSELTKGFDDAISATGSVVNDAVDSGQKIALEYLLKRIDAFGYDTVGQVKGDIHSHLDKLNTNDEARQYEIDARADHASENQFS